MFGSRSPGYCERARGSYCGKSRRIRRMVASMPPGPSAAVELAGLAHGSALSPHALQLRLHEPRMNPGFLVHSPDAAQLAHASLESAQP